MDRKAGEYEYRRWVREASTQNQPRHARLAWSHAWDLAWEAAYEEGLARGRAYQWLGVLVGALLVLALVAVGCVLADGWGWLAWKGV